jgi:hypothetical protein
MTARPLLRFILICTALACACAATARAEDSFQRLRGVLIDYFAEQGYLPVLVDRGYQVGDIVNLDGINLYARASRCFPNLKMPPATPATLANIVNIDTAGISLGLKLRQIFDSNVGGDLARKIQIKFSDVSVRSVALLDLRDALDRLACPEIAPLVDGTLRPLQPGEQPYFVVSEVMSGKREARLEFATRADLSAKADQITRQLADATLSVNASGDGTVILASMTVSTIALKPVTVPKVVQLSSFERSIRGGQSEEQLLWQPLQCQSTDSCWKQLGPFAEQIKTSPVRLSPEELDH